MLGVFAEFERVIIQERIHAGLARTQEKGTKSGRAIGRARIDRQRAWLLDAGDDGFPAAYSIPAASRFEPSVAGAILSFGFVAAELIGKLAGRRETESRDRLRQGPQDALGRFGRRS